MGLPANFDVRFRIAGKDGKVNKKFNNSLTSPFK